MTDTPRNRVAVAVARELLLQARDCGEYQTRDSYKVADAVIEALRTEWRADFGYDGYAKCETRDEARAQVDEFNAALGDDIRDGEQAMVMHRYVTEWEIHD